MEMFQVTQKRLLGELLVHPELQKRVERLASIRGVGPVTALTWALEVGDPFRFSCCAQAMSYCGLTSALKSSADKQQRGPISKQRNPWLQTALIEDVKLAPRCTPADWSADIETAPLSPWPSTSSPSCCPWSN